MKMDSVLETWVLMTKSSTRTTRPVIFSKAIERKALCSKLQSQSLSMNVSSFLCCGTCAICRPETSQLSLTFAVSE